MCPKSRYLTYLYNYIYNYVRRYDKDKWINVFIIDQWSYLPNQFKLKDMSIKTCLYVLIFISSSFSLSIHVRSPIASLFPIGHYPRFNWNSFLMPLIRSPPPPLLSPMKTSNKILPSHSELNFQKKNISAPKINSNPWKMQF